MKKEIEAIYPASPLQVGMLYQSRLNPNKGVYVVQLAFELVGKLDVTGFKRAWEKIIERHAVFRTLIVQLDHEKPLQVVRRTATLPWEVFDWQELAPGEQQSKLMEVLREQRRMDFSPEKAPMMRIQIIQTGVDRHEFVWSLHHALADGWSLPLVLRDVFILYQSQLENEAVASLPPVRAYQDYIRWLGKQDQSRIEAFWSEYLGGFESPNRLAIDRGPGQRHAEADDILPKRHVLNIAADEVDRLVQFARQERITPNIIAQAAWALVVSKYSERRDVLFGTVVAGRPPELPGSEEIVGPLINTLPTRTIVPTGGSVREWIHSLHADQIQRDQYAFSPLAELKRFTNCVGDSPLFETLFAFENYPIAGASAAASAAGEHDLKIGAVVSVERNSFPLSLVIVPGEQWSLQLTYDPTRFPAGSVGNLLTGFRRAMISITENPTAHPPAICLLDAAERNALIDAAISEQTDEEPESILTRIERKSSIDPDQVAVEDGARRLTYDELLRQSQQFALDLTQRGIQRGDVVAICMRRRVDLLAALLGTMRVGAAFVPIDPDTPAERIRFLISDSGCRIAISERELEFVDHSCDWISVNTRRDTGNSSHVATCPEPEELAYLLYTSGTTGRPKGVAITHGGLNHYLSWAADQYINEGGSGLVHSSIAFDATLTTLLAPLYAGGRVVLLDHRDDIEVLADVLNDAANPIDLLKVTPSHLDALNAVGHRGDLAACANATLVIGGEALLSATLKPWQDKLPGARFINEYGPTEAVVGCCVHEVGHGESGSIPIGRPIRNASHYVLDRDLQLVPNGCVGELYIGGSGIARGYWRRERLSAEQFIPDPFAKGKRLYRSGDRVRWRDDGELEFLGRRDEQVKIRGYRIELSEIRSVLSEHSAVKDCAVIVVGEGREQQIIAYAVFENPGTQEIREVNDFLSVRLPRYMLPNRIMALDAIPLTANGKLNQAALKASLDPGLTASFDALSSPNEKAVAEIVCDVLKLESVGVRDNFFEVGGHSLSAAQVVARLEKLFDRQLSLKTVFEHPTVEQLAHHVANAQCDRTRPPLVPRASVHAPLSFAQERMWVLAALGHDNGSYNVPLSLSLKGSLDFMALRNSFDAVLSRHEILRSRVVESNDRVRIEPISKSSFKLPVIDLSHLPMVVKEAVSISLAENEALRPFDLKSAPLLRARLVAMSPRDHVLLVTSHHMVSDHWSTGLMMKEIGDCYTSVVRGEPLQSPPLPLQYADYAAWQRDWLHGPVLQELLDHWTSRLAGLPPLLELATDRPRPAVQDTTGACCRFSIDAELTSRIKKISQREGTSLFMTLLAAFDLLLWRYSGQTDIAVGTPISDRPDRALEGLIGFFINTLVVRTRVNGSASFKDLLASVKKSCLDAFQHQHLPFERLVEALQPERSRSYSPLFQVLFTMQNASSEPFRLAGLDIFPARQDVTVAKFDLALSMTEIDGCLHGSFDYATALFDAETIASMAAHFETLLAAVASGGKRPVGQLDILADEDLRRLEQWNRTAGPLPECMTLHASFERQAARTPDSIALVVGAKSFSFIALSEQVNRLAARLASRLTGVGPEACVGVCLPRDERLLIALLAVLKTGACYVPLDPDYPSERIAFMLNDSDASLLIGLKETTEAYRDTGVEVLNLDAASIPGTESRDTVCPVVDPQQLAYVIYTSGSTGIPKGVAISHRSAIVMLAWAAETFGPNEREGVLAGTSVCFDLSVYELFLPLTTGGTIHLADNAVALSEMISREAVTLINTVPSAVEALLAVQGVPDGVITVNLAGEPLARDLVERIYALENVSSVFNLYGPSEDTTYSTGARIHPTASARPSIGAPLANRTAYVLDDELNALPPGVVGELFLAGEGTARCYLNRAALTAERFIPDPRQPGGRMYRTGDLARWKRDGELDFQGRADQQVKVRGFRIELGEIESRLREMEGLADSAVVVREDAPGRRMIVGYVVAVDDVDEGHVRQYLSRKLPDYMVPQAIVFLSSLPLTPNGKVDKRALPRPALAADSYVAPKSEIERTLARIWANLLGLDRVSVQENFFALGGDSIIAIQVVGRARQAGIELAAKDLFERQTVAELADAATFGKTVFAEQQVLTGAFGLTPIQHWFFDAIVKARDHFNQAVLLRPPAYVSARKMARALNVLTDHHDALRLRFFHDGAGWRQRYLERTPVHVTSIDLAGLTELSGVWQRTVDQVQRSLDIERGPVQRMVLFNIPGGDQRLLWTVHHLAVDGVSWRILLEDLHTVMSERPLLSKTSSYRAWSARLQAYANEVEPDHWEALGGRPIAQLPKDPPATATGAAISTTAMLGRDDTERLMKNVHDAYRTGMEDILLTALCRLLANELGQENHWFEIEGHGREALFQELDASRTVGWFTSMYPVCLQLAPEAGLADSIKSVKQQLNEIRARGIEFGLIRYLAAPEKREVLRNVPEPKISFNYLGQFNDPEFNENAWSFAGEGVGRLSGQAQTHEMQISVLVNAGQLAVRVDALEEYGEFAQTVSEQFVANLQALIEHCIRPENGGFAPCDVPGIEISQPQLDAAMAELQLPARSIQAIYPLSPVQSGTLVESERSGEGAYVVQVLVGFEGPLDRKALGKAWQSLVDRHDIFRTAFLPASSHLPVQLVLTHAEIGVECHDGLAPDQAPKALEDWLKTDRKRGFDANKAPLMRIAVFATGNDRWTMVWSHHHAVCDGWSLPIVLRELMALYHSAAGNRATALATAPRYRRYIEWMMRQDRAAARRFWTEELMPLETPTRLGLERPGGTQEITPDSLSLSLGNTRSEQLRSAARRVRVTLNTMVQAAWAVLLHTYSGERNVVFGAVSSGRPAELADSEIIVGPFINTLPVCVRHDNGASVGDWLRGIQARQVERERHGYLPLNEIRRLAMLDEPGAALFETLLVFENYPLGEAVSDTHGEASAEVRMSFATAREQTSFPLTLFVLPDSDVSFRVDFDACRYARADMERVLAHLRQILISLAQRPERVGHIEVVSAEERRKLINPAQRISFPDVGIHEWFARQVASAPAAVALVDGERRITYAELDRWANTLAVELLAHGVQREEHIAVCLPRDWRLAVSLLAILKAGAVYVPLDPAYPADRIHYMLEDGQAKMVLGTSATVHQLADARTEMILLDDFKNWNAHLEPVSKSVEPGQLAYVIYTSGSTGHPNGVAISHGNAVAMLAWAQRRFDRDSMKGVLASTSVCFDLSIFELFLPWVSGTTVHLAGTALELETLPSRDAVTLLNTVPSAMEALLKLDAVPDTVLEVNLAGEPLSRELVDRIYALGHVRKVNNLYGPSEDTTYSTEATVPADSASKPLIGAPIANTCSYVLDAELKPTPQGVVGQLYLSGAGVARGYFNRPALTAQRFLPNPFGDGERMYCTADLVRLDPGGQLDFLGRADQQVKVRGFRIEPGEIEARLLALEDIQEAKVIVREDEGGRPHLTAYVVSTCAEKKEEIWRESLQNVLPDYMVPQSFVRLEAMPLTPNGKVDRNALPSPDIDSRKGFSPLRNEAERALGAIWCDLLGLERVGRNDNFFALGGDSIIGIQVVSRARQRGLVLTSRQCFEFQTIAELASVADTVMAVRAEQGTVQGEVVPTPIQCWFLETVTIDRHHFNQAMLLRPREAIDTNQLERAVASLVVHHDALRSRFLASDPDGWRHRITGDLDIAGLVESVDLSESEDWREKWSGLALEAQRSLDLQAGRVMCLLHARLPAGEQRLLWIVHHLVVDGVSWRILLEDLDSAYSGRALPPKTSSVRDWANGLQAEAASIDQSEVEYWRALVETHPFIELPASGRRVEVHHFELNADTTRRLLERANRPYRTSIDELLLAALGRSLRVWRGEDTHWITHENHGRDLSTEELDLSRTVGWFTRMYPVPLSDFGGPIGDQICTIKEQLRGIPGKGAGFGVLRYLARDAVVSAVSMPEIAFNYLGQFDQMMDESGRFHPAGGDLGATVSERQQPAHKIEFTAMVLEGRLQLRALGTIEGLADLLEQYGSTLQAFVDHCCEDAAGALTPSDIPELQLDSDQLKSVLADINQAGVERAYPLTPIQLATLSHSLASPQTGVYCMQMSCDISGDFNPSAFREAWQSILDRHDIFRTSFAGLDGKTPLQIVHHQVELPWIEHDWRDLKNEECRDRFEALAEHDRSTGFDIFTAPLMRVYMIRLEADKWRFMWSVHHSLSDGWSQQRVFQELMIAYEERCAGRTRVADRAPSYRNFVSWLYGRDVKQAEAFWRGYLEGAAPTLIAGPENHAEKIVAHDQLEVLSDSISAGLRALAKRWRVTLSLLLQSGWALVLADHAGRRDVLFGTSTSGRHPEIPRVEEIVGPFINTVPVRMKIADSVKLSAWVDELRMEQIQRSEHEHLSLRDVQRASELNGIAGLFDSLLMVENYPFAGVGEQSSQNRALRLENADLVSLNSFPMTLTVTPGRNVRLWMSSNTTLVNKELATRLVRRYTRILEAIVSEPDSTVGKLLSALQRSDLKAVGARSNRAGALKGLKKRKSRMA